MSSELLTIPQFCEAANVGRTTAYNLINLGDLKAVKCGKKTLIRKADMEAWIARLISYKAPRSKKTGV